VSRRLDDLDELLSESALLQVLDVPRVAAFRPPVEPTTHFVGTHNDLDAVRQRRVQEENSDGPLENPESCQNLLIVSVNASGGSNGLQHRGGAG
jgi:hypothetical protein